MNLLLNILFFVLTIFQTNISVAKVIVPDATIINPYIPKKY